MKKNKYRDFTTCANGDKCINPKQGRLNMEDFHRATGNIGKRTYNCGMCEVQKHRDIRALKGAPPSQTWSVEMANRVIRGGAYNVAAN